MSKKPEEVLQEVIDTINPLRGVLDVGVLTDEVRKNVLKIEMDKAGELIPVINMGVNECLNRDYTVAIIKNASFRPPPTATVQLVDNKGNLLGEEIVSNNQKKKYKEDEKAKFINPDFVLLKDQKDIEEDLKTENLEKNPTKQAFLLPPVQFIEVEELEDTCDVVSSSPDPLADLYLKEVFNFEDDPKLASILVGFNIKD
ncbi:MULTISPECIES: hypothetical protein [Methanosphaera]|uniref:Uncharacterized protein n=1 Tax=Methanosphaera stadtmanae (strain ATCC 43021 / DSM 3091 / JCM 11832 / MCB-3) TaxID=339860 RepID=Q2NHN3_METST|nr:MULTISPECIES: hypothetical protein [Methanosphaera]ABC56600.1 hypothetical protein Msp_0183 [Methanosphaera stadtmanae DSM 3091]OEC89968.1 hypothetical protein A9758_02700 [Methanosphaera sp. A6]